MVRPSRTGTIRQVVRLPAVPADVYRALMTSAGHRAFTGAPARVSPRVGGKFVVWGGYIHGTNLKLVPGKLIVQSWRPSEDGWPEDYYSTVRFELAETPRGSRLTFTHSGVPTDHVAHLSKGWKESYWEPLRTYLRKK